MVSRECGKPRHEALVHEVTTLLDAIGWVCKDAPRRAGAPSELQLHLMKHRSSEVRYVPRGVVGVVSPWNFPLVIPMGSVVEALVAGNACVVKPSEVTPLVMLEAKKIYDSTGLPEDLFAVVIGYGPTGQALIDAGIDYCVFTGRGGDRAQGRCGVRASASFRAPWSSAARRRSSPARTATSSAPRAPSSSAGSPTAGRCASRSSACTRTSGCHEPLLDRVRALAGELRQGDPAKDFVDVGAIIFPKQIDVAREHVQDALQKGARLVCGGKPLPGPGQFFEPTVLADCDHSMSVMREEIFGPVVPFMRVASDDEAIALANDSHLGLNAYVFTESPRARAAARR